MAEASGPNLCAFSICGVLSLSFLIYHTYRFDRCRCLIPSRKNWFRGLLTWMLFISNMCMIVWAATWCYCKYQLGWVRLGRAGARSWPSALFPSPFNTYQTPLSAILAICYSFQVSLTAEEALYMTFLMRAVRRPQAAAPFLKSRLFYGWVFVTVSITAVQLIIRWVGQSSDLQVQLSKELLISGFLEMAVLACSTIVVFRFPAFLLDVKAAGAGPSVQSRLYYYHEANKVRTLFRFGFTIPLFIIGCDGLTKAAVINMTPMAADLLSIITAGSLSVVMMISITLYLPLSPPSSLLNGVMVRRSDNHAASGMAVMSLLEERGRWDGLDDDMKPGHEVPFANAGNGGAAYSAEEKRRGEHAGPSVPKTLESFVSPIDVSAEAQPQRPFEIRMQVERDVHVDEGEGGEGGYKSRRGRVFGEEDA